jgi:hypothetical protein
MTLKRRSFLAVFGAAIAAPALPMAAPTHASAAYSRYMYGLAVFHARTRAYVSARGLKVSQSQAKAMIAEMTTSRLVKPVGLSGGNVRAVSNIRKPDAWGLNQAARNQRSVTGKAKHAAKRDLSISALMAHVRKICLSHGMTLHPRCAV